MTSLENLVDAILGNPGYFQKGVYIRLITGVTNSFV